MNLLKKIKNLESEKFIKINEHCIIGRPHEWGKELQEDDYVFVIGIKSSHLCDDNEFEVVAKSKSLEEVLLNALIILSQVSKQGICFEVLEDFSFTDIANMFFEKKGSIQPFEAQWKMKADDADKEHLGGNYHHITLYTEGDKCYGVSQ